MYFQRLSLKLMIIYMISLLSACGSIKNHSKQLFKMAPGDLLLSKKAKSLNDLPDEVGVGKFKIDLSKFKKSKSFGLKKLNEIKSLGSTLLDSKINIKFSKKGWLVITAKIKYKPTALGCSLAQTKSICLKLFTEEEVKKNKNLQKLAEQNRNQIKKTKKSLDQYSPTKLLAMSDTQLLNTVQKSTVLEYKEKLLIPLSKIGKRAFNAIKKGKNPVSLDLFKGVSFDKDSFIEKVNKKAEKREKAKSQKPKQVQNRQQPEEKKILKDQEYISIAGYHYYDEARWFFEESVETFWTTYFFNTEAKIYYELAANVPIKTNLNAQKNDWLVKMAIIDGEENDYKQANYPKQNRKELIAKAGGKLSIRSHLPIIDDINLDHGKEYDFTKDLRRNGDVLWPMPGKSELLFSFELPIDLSPVPLLKMKPTLDLLAQGKELFAITKKKVNDFLGFSLPFGKKISQPSYLFKAKVDLGVNVEIGLDLELFTITWANHFNLVPLVAKDISMPCKYNCLLAPND